MNAHAPANPYLSGNFAPVRGEDDFCPLPIVGEIPAGLHGTFFRNGPNPQFAPRDAYHWFAGDGMVHAFQLTDGEVRYRNRYVRTPKFEVENAASRALFGTFGNPTTSDPSVHGKDSGLANTNIVFHAGRLLALEEAHQPTEMDSRTLATKGYVPLAGRANRFTAHPKIDPETGEMVFFGYSAGEGYFTDQVMYGVADRAGKVTRLEQFTGPYCSMIHDFMVTRDHVLFPVLPLTGSLPRAMQGGPAFAWEPDKGSHVCVMRRDAGVGTVRWFTTDATYVFHVMNTWEEGDKIFAHVMQYENAPMFPNADGSHGAHAAARLALWTFDLAGDTNTIRREYIDDIAGEFPRLDERRAGLQYRHGYFAANTRPDSKMLFNAIAHTDFATGKRALYTLPNGDVTGEPVFVPRAPDAPEGDGWLLAIVYRGAEDRSDFCVLDAQDMAKGPIAIAQLPRRVPFGFHGNWVEGV